MNELLCKDCKHVIPEYFLWWETYEFALCSKSINGQRIDLVTGEKRNQFDSASIARLFSDKCGQHGQWWEKK